MRDILFRGKRVDNGEWIQGFYVYCTDGDKLSHRIYSSFSESYGEKTLYPIWFEVIPETVGQYTGLTDKNGMKVFEGDICRFKQFRKGYVGKIVLCKEACLFEVRWNIIVGAHGEKATQSAMLCHVDNPEAIGNVHDNPELLGGDDRG